MRKIKTYLIDEYDKFYIRKCRSNEIKKYKDTRRTDIYSTIKLSDKQMREIDDLYMDNYGEKIPYTWHKHFTAFTGNFDKYYFPELLYIPEFEHFMNYRNGFVKVLNDKNFIDLVAHGGVLKLLGYSCQRYPVYIEMAKIG